MRRPCWNGDIRLPKLTLKVKIALEQSMRVHRGSRGVAIILFLQPRRYMWWVVNATVRPLYPWEIPGTHCTGGWLGLRAGLDGFGKSHPHWDSIPRPSIPQRTAIPTELSGPCYEKNLEKVRLKGNDLYQDTGCLERDSKWVLPGQKT